MNVTARLLSPLIITFALFSILFLAMFRLLQNLHTDPYVLLIANALLFFISIFSMIIQLKGLHHKNPHVFVRSVMTGMLMKMAICLLAVFLYVYLSGNAYNKRGIFLSLFLYLVYLAVEVSAVMKLNKNRKTDA
jgi:ABC-type Fe3+-siderophore transport system permease subunit